MIDDKINPQAISARSFQFAETSFNVLMRRRIHKVLLICSNYDFFMLEEDGRIDEQIFNEYVSLNLRYPPQFIHVTSAAEAIEVLKNGQIDLIIEMLSVGDMEPFALARNIKSHYQKIPLVVLTPFSREVSMILEKEDTSAVDYIFCWLGNTDLLMAIIKLIEDKMNVASDVKHVGLQTILLVEDSVRFYSSYLPIIYKIILKQSHEFMSEGLNEHEKMLRLRGRPKILLARSFEEASRLYGKYRNNLLGVISDVSFNRNGKKDKQAGIRLIHKIKADDKYMPILMQSSDSANSELAKELRVGFINKNSKTLLKQIEDFINEYFAFGDFVFRDPDTGHEILRVQDLKSLQKCIYMIPDGSFEYHISRNHFSKWLNARALFPIAELFREVSKDDFKDLNHVRNFLFDAISNFRLNKGRGVIAKFYRDKYDEYLNFARIGDGSMGGKARGLAFLDLLIKNHPELDDFDKVFISIPRTVVLTSDIFDNFMEINQLYEIAYSDSEDEHILNAFHSAILPDGLREDLYAFVSVSRSPIAIRSSSLLEDSHYQPFAGVYSTYMLPYISDNYRMVDKIEEAIKAVFASVFFRSSKAYLTATRHVIDEEKMSIILQQVCGETHGKYYYPTISGVVRSINFYPIEPEKAGDGVANVCFGLGKTIVEGGRSIRFSPKHPKRVLQLSDAGTALSDSQKSFFALDLDPESFRSSTDDAVNLVNLSIREAEGDPSLHFVASVFDPNDGTLKEGLHYKGRKVITFTNILKYESFPLANILKTVSTIAHQAMNSPVEIEFAMNIPSLKDKPALFNLLQVRPIVDNSETLTSRIEEIPEKETIIYSRKALGNGEIKKLYDLVYVKVDSFDPAKNPEIARRITLLNEKFVKEGKNYVLIGPGRWGSSDHWLGIPVKWANISAAKVIVEAGLHNYRIEPSQGTHFFQNLTSFRVGYLTINPYINDGHYDLVKLDNYKAVWEDEFLRHIQFDNELVIKIDGKKNLGIIM
ncbi:MAG: PEP/pyruvate-binding domain-containing protein [Bacteroidales bacterium]